LFKENLLYIVGWKKVVFINFSPIRKNKEIVIARSLQLRGMLRYPRGPQLPKVRETRR
jgi:hypothetical protein